MPIQDLENLLDSFDKTKSRRKTREEMGLTEPTPLSFSPVSTEPSPLQVGEGGVIGRAAEAFTEERQKGQIEGAEVSRELQEGEIGIGTALAGQAASAKQ